MAALAKIQHLQKKLCRTYFQCSQKFYSVIIAQCFYAVISVTNLVKKLGFGHRYPKTSFLIRLASEIIEQKRCVTITE